MKPLRIHYFQHVYYEDLGCIEDWVLSNGHGLSFTKWYETSQLPRLEEIDWLIIMGGPMGVHDVEQYPWLEAEKTFIRSAIAGGKMVLGICLGAQLIASVLNAKVYPNAVKEIGWFPVKKLDNDSLFFGEFPENLTVFHWHGDTFEIPGQAVPLFSSSSCINQGFVLNEKVLALQFHFEVTKKSLELMVENGSHELIAADYIQPAEKLLSHPELVKENNDRMFRLLNRFAGM